MIRKLMFIKGTRLEVVQESDSLFCLKQNNVVVITTPSLDEALVLYRNKSEEISNVNV